MVSLVTEAGAPALVGIRVVRGVPIPKGGPGWSTAISVPTGVSMFGVTPSGTMLKSCTTATGVCGGAGGGANEDMKPWSIPLLFFTGPPSLLLQFFYFCGLFSSLSFRQLLLCGRLPFTGLPLPAQAQFIDLLLCEAVKDEVKHLVQGRVNIRRRGGGGGGGDGKRVKVRVNTRDINLLCRVFQGPSPLLACHLRDSRGRVSCGSFLSWTVHSRLSIWTERMKEKN